MAKKKPVKKPIKKTVKKKTKKKDPKEKKIKATWLVFAKHYSLTWNATESYHKAYPKTKLESCRKLGHILTTNVDILHLVNEQCNKRMKRLDIHQDHIVSETAKLAFSDIKNYLDKDGNIDFSKVPDEVSSAIKSYKETTIDVKTEGKAKTTKTTREITLHDKIKPIELLGKQLALYVDKKEVEHKGYMVVTPEIAEMMNKEKKK